MGAAYMGLGGSCCLRHEDKHEQRSLFPLAALWLGIRRHHLQYLQLVAE